MNNPPALKRLLRRVASDIRVRRAERGAWRGGFWGATIAVAVLAAKGWFGDSALPIAFAIMGLSIASGAVFGACRRIAPLVSARLADHAFGLQDRVATTLEWSSRPHPLAGALLADTVSRLEELERSGLGPRRIAQRRFPREARLLALPLVAAAALALAPPLPGPESWLDGLGERLSRDPGSSVSFVERMKLFGTDLIRRNPLAMQDLSRGAADDARSAANEAAEFKDRAIAKQRSDFASFVKQGDERLRLLERTDRLPDLQSDFATSRYRVLLKKSQELSAGQGPNRISAAKLGQILREMERLGKRGGDWSEDVSDGLEALEEGQTEEAMEAMQSALGKIRAMEDRQRAGRLLRGGREARRDDREEGGRGEAGALALNDMDRRGGYSLSKGGPSKGAPTARLRSTPYDTGIAGARRGRMPAYETQMTGRPGSSGAQLQYAGEIGQYRRLMEDAIAREQVPRDYHNQIRDYFKSLQEQ